MFVITRNQGEEIWIGDPKSPSVVIQVMTVKENGRVRIGIRTDDPNSVHRGEVARQLRDEGDPPTAVTPIN